MGRGIYRLNTSTSEENQVRDTKLSYIARLIASGWGGSSAPELICAVHSLIILRQKSIIFAYLELAQTLISWSEDLECFTSLRARIKS